MKIIHGLYLPLLPGKQIQLIKKNILFIIFLNILMNILYIVILGTVIASYN